MKKQVSQKYGNLLYIFIFYTLFQISISPIVHASLTDHLIHPSDRHLSNQLLSEVAVIAHLPEARDHYGVNHIYLGDLHGNALKLVYFLLREGFLEFKDPEKKKELYQELVDITQYYDPTYRYATQAIDRWNAIITDELKVRNPKTKKPTIELLGDLLSDRGRNDLMTLITLNKLHQINSRLTQEFEIEYNIYISNHDLGFLSSYNSDVNFFPLSSLDNFFSITGFNTSFINLFDYLRIANLTILGRKRVDSFRSYVESAYLPHLKLVTFADKQFTSHAPVGLEVIRDLSKLFLYLIHSKNIPIESDEFDKYLKSFQICRQFDFSHYFDPKLLYQCSDDMNRLFQKILSGQIPSISLNELFLTEPTDEYATLYDSARNRLALNNPIYYLTWNRYSELRKLIRTSGYTFIHGHDKSNGGNFYVDTDGTIEQLYSEWSEFQDITSNPFPPNSSSKTPDDVFVYNLDNSFGITTSNQGCNIEAKYAIIATQNLQNTQAPIQFRQGVDQNDSNLETEPKNVDFWDLVHEKILMLFND